MYLDRTKVDFYEKTIECLDEQGVKRVLWGKKKQILVRLITTMQTKFNNKKGGTLFPIQVPKHERTNTGI